MNKQLWRAGLLCCIGAAGCGQSIDEETTLEQAMLAICDSPAAAVAAGETRADPAEQAAAASRWIAANVENQPARTFFADLARLPPSQKAARLREEATRAGIERCLLAEIWTSRPR